MFILLFQHFQVCAPSPKAHDNYKYFSGQNLGYILGGLSVIGRRDKLRHQNRVTAAGLDKSA